MLRRLKRTDKVFISFLETWAVLFLPLFIFGCAFVLGIRDTKIPKELTLRTGKFDMDLFRGVLRDIDYVVSSSPFRDMRLLYLGHLDPFVLIASFISTAYVSKFLYAAYVIRLSLASFTMHRFLKKQVPLSVPVTVLLGVVYSLSSPVLGISSYSCAMNTVILIPVFLDFLIEYLRDDTSLEKGMFLSLIITALLYVSGGLNLLSVLPFVIITSLVVAMAVGRNLGSSLILFLKTLPFTLVSVGLSAFTLANTILSSDIPLTGDDLIDLELRSSMFDLFIRFFNGKAFQMSLPSGIGLSMTVFVLILVLLFFFNPSIPIRLRSSLAFCVIAYYAFYSSNFLFKISILFSTTVMNTGVITGARFAFLSSLLIFAAAISLRNIGRISNTLCAGVCFAVIAFVILSNNSRNEVTPSFFSMYFTALCVIVTYFLIKKRERIHPLISSCLVLSGLLLNLSFILPISSYGAPTDEAAVLFDNREYALTTEIPLDNMDFFEKDNDDFYILNGFSNEYQNLPEMLNLISASSVYEPLFMPLMNSNSIFRDGERPVFNGADMVEGGKTVVSYKMYSLEFWELENDLYVYTDHKGPVTLIIEKDGEETMTELNGPVLRKMDLGGAETFSAKFLIDDPNIRERSIYSFYTVDQEVVDAFVSKAQTYDGPFEVTGNVTVLTGRKSDNMVKVKVDGQEVETYDIGGKLAFDIETDKPVTVSIETWDIFLFISLCVVMFSVICSIVVILLFRVKERRS